MAKRLPKGVERLAPTVAALAAERGEDLRPVVILRFADWESCARWLGAFAETRCERQGLASMADDSGLWVDSLDVVTADVL